MIQLDKPLTEKIVADLLMRDRFAKNVCIPCYTPEAWWENDVLMITEAGYWVEFEIKLTLADFKVDAQKERQVMPWPWNEPKKFENKHDLLANSDRGPAQFYYVAPAGVIPVALLPAWAGLIEIEQSGKSFYERRPTVKAPRRHKNKVPDGWRTAIFETCYWRFHRLR